MAIYQTESILHRINLVLNYNWNNNCLNYIVFLKPTIFQQN